MTSKDWQSEIEQRVDADVVARLNCFLEEQERLNKTVFPDQSCWFNALNSVALSNVKVVILGQDPYHGPSQAHGMSFSVQDNIKVPPSLKNIFKEQSSDLGLTNHSGNLMPWAEQGVLLLNAVLTVESGKAGSHAGKGWEQITDSVIQACNDQETPIVFLLWGAYAIKKQSLITGSQHCILTAPHPSPLSAHRGFFGCAHFSRTNKFLIDAGRKEIDWRTDAVSQETFSF